MSFQTAQHPEDQLRHQGLPELHRWEMPSGCCMLVRDFFGGDTEHTHTHTPYHHTDMPHRHINSTHKHIYKYTHMHTHTYYIHPQMYTPHACIHINMHTHRHTYTQTRIHRRHGVSCMSHIPASKIFQRTSTCGLTQAYRPSGLD